MLRWINQPRAATPTAVARNDLLACHECDWLHTRTVLPKRAEAFCERCGASLRKAPPNSFDLTLGLAFAGLIMLAVAHLNPVFGIELQGITQSASLWQAAMTLFAENAWFLGVLVIMTTLLFPAIELGAVCYLLIPLRSGQIAPGFAPILRTMQAVRPWVMVEVFMLGVLIAVVKLSSLADILPGAGVWAFAAVMLLLAGTTASLDHESLWDCADQAQAD